MKTRTHHTNMDNYDHLMPDDLKQASMVVAWFVYNAAMRSDKLPRKALPGSGPWLFDALNLGNNFLSSCTQVETSSVAVITIHSLC